MENRRFGIAQSKMQEIKDCENTIKELMTGDLLQALGRIYANTDEQLIEILIKYHRDKLERLNEEFKQI